jgi:hypothetical protein
MPKLTKEEKGRLADRLFELYRVTGNGTRDLATVEQGLQELIEGTYPRGLTIAESHQVYDTPPPSWWRTPEQQLERARELWPDAVLPEPPKMFVPRTSTEVLLLHVPDDLQKLWSMVAIPEGYSKHGWPHLITRLSPDVREHTRPVWLAFDPEHGRGVNPVSLWGQKNLAASEVISALIQFRNWPLAWSRDGSSTPLLSGYQSKHDDWSFVPNLLRVAHDSCPFIELGNVYVNGSTSDYWASPTAREC